MTQATAAAAPPFAHPHPTVQELLRRASAIQGVGPVIVQTLADLIHPQDPVLFCHYLLDAPTQGGGYYACDVTLVTSAYFVTLGIFPKSHTFRKKKVHAVTDVQVKYDPPGIETMATIPAGAFIPSNLALTASFADEQGKVVETWTVESSDPNTVRNLGQISRTLNRVVGFPLARVVTPQAAGSTGPLGAGAAS